MVLVWFFGLGFGIVRVGFNRAQFVEVSCVNRCHWKYKTGLSRHGSER